MKVKIIQCSEVTYWYKNRIGEMFNTKRAVIYPENYGKGFEVVLEGKRHYINDTDAEIVFEDF